MGTTDINPLWGMVKAPDIFGNFQAGAQAGQQQQIQTNRRNALQQIAMGADGQPDYAATSQKLLAAGDIQGAQAVAQVAQTQQQQRIQNEDLKIKQGTFDLAKQTAAQKQIVFQDDPNLPGSKVPYQVTPDGKVTRVQLGDNPNAAPAKELTGNDYLNSLPTARKNQVQAVISGLQPYPSGARLGPQAQLLQRDVNQYAPNFDATLSQQRMKTMQSFSGSGQDATAITSAHQALGHIGSALDAVDKLNNYNTSVGPFNTVMNTSKNYLNPKPAQDFKTLVNPIVDEITKAWRGNGGSAADIESWKKEFNDAKSPDELRGLLAGVADAIKVGVETRRSKWNDAMGPVKPPKDFYPPQVLESANRVMKAAGHPAWDNPNGAPQAVQPQQPAQNGTPRPVASQQEYQALPSGSQYVAPDGSVRTKQ